MAVTDVSLAQTYPARPVRLIVGSSAGGGGDGVARVTAAKLSPLLGQQWVIDNRPGAAGNIGAEMVARAAPDGYTLLFAYTGHVINPALFRTLPFDPLRDLVRGHFDERLARTDTHGIKIFIAATNVRTGKVRIFTREDLTIDALLASACLPNVHDAVVIDGVHVRACLHEQFGGTNIAAACCRHERRLALGQRAVRVRAAPARPADADPRRGARAARRALR